MKTKKTNLQITFVAKSGLSVILKATNEEQRDVWVAALTSQIEALNEKKKSLACKLPAEARAMLLYNSTEMIAVPSLATDSTCWLKENEEHEKNANKKDVKFLLEKSVAKKEGNVPKINEVKPKDTSKVAQDSDCNTDSETEVDARVPSVLGKIPREETKEAAELLFV